MRPCGKRPPPGIPSRPRWAEAERFGTRIAYDPDADLIYFGTGNAGPWPADLRKAEGKDNLYVASIIALKADTGEYKWHFQTGARRRMGL